MQSGNPGKLSEGLIISRTNVASVVSAVKSIQNSGTSILKGAGGGGRKMLFNLCTCSKERLFFAEKELTRGGGIIRDYLSVCMQTTTIY